MRCSVYALCLLYLSLHFLADGLLNRRVVATRDLADFLVTDLRINNKREPKPEDPRGLLSFWLTFCEYAPGS